MQVIPVLSWLLLLASLFVGFTVQGAMWKGAEDANRNGWVVALVWSLVTAIVIKSIHTAFHIWIAPCR